MNDKILLPHDVEMEKAVLAALLLKDGTLVPKISSVLLIEDFYREEHRIIYKSILKLFAEGTPPNLLSLLDELRKSGDLKKVTTTLVLALADAGYTTAYAEYHAKVIKEKSILRKIIDLCDHISEQAQNAIAPVNDIISRSQSILQSLTDSDSTKNVDFVQAFKHSFKNDINQDKKFLNRSTGFHNLDKFQIFSPGLYVIGATPAAGKTTFCWQLLEQISHSGETCIYCSYEMSSIELLAKSAARTLFLDDKHTSLSATDIRRGSWSRQLDSVIDHFANEHINLKIFQLQDESVDELLNLLRPFCYNNSAPVVCLDYLQIVPHDSLSTKSGIDDIVRKLKKFQRDTNTTFIVISSFNRNNYAQPVAFESFKESGGIEYSADVLWALQLNILNSIKGGDLSNIRHKISDAKNSSPRQIQLKCLKNRNGSDYDCFFNYFPAHDYFEPCEENDFLKDYESRPN